VALAALAAALLSGQAAANDVFSAKTFLIDPAIRPAAPDGEHPHAQDAPAQPVNPRPLPMPSPAAQAAVPRGRLVTFDLVTRTETTSDAPASPVYEDSSQAEQTEDGIGGGIVEPATPGGTTSIMDFSSLTRVSNQTTFPYCATVKLYMQFATTDWWVASGALIDPMHVLTAGHCVYDATMEAGGGWATQMIVVPAFSNPDKPFGEANSVQLHSWSGWTNNASFDHDIGLISLDRPVGALTGWYAYGYNDSSSFYKNTQFENPGYPAAPPYNGQYMYTWSGTFDSTDMIGKTWYGNEVTVRSPAYGGQSGSNAFTTSGSTRTTYAVLSNGNSLVTNFPRITSDKFADIRDSYIGNDVPPTFDLTPLNVTAEPATVVAGNALTAFNCLIHNYSSASWSGTVTIQVYLSTDNTITTSDTLIQTQGLTTTLSSMASVRAEFAPPPTIPLATTGGDRYLGVILSISDYDSTNNKTMSWDTKRVTVVQALSAPGGLTAGAGTSTESIGLSWNSVSGASHYRLSRAATSDGAKTVVADWQTTRTFTDTTATPGANWYYWVQAAADATGYRASAYSSVATGWRAFTSPANVQASKGQWTTGVTVYWAAVPYATYYRVYRSDGGAWQPLSAWQEDISCTDTSALAGTVYSYCVTAAADGSGLHESAFSTPDTGWVRVVHTLTVTAAPIDGIGFTGDGEGVTPYDAICDDGESIELVAPEHPVINDVECLFIRWVLDGLDEPDAIASLSFTMDAPHSAEIRATVFGDVNDDCTVNILDLIVVRNNLGASTSTGNNWRSDVNNDGKINILDLIAIRNRLGAHCP